MENLDDAKIIDGFSAFGNMAAAGGAGYDVFSEQLAAALTEFHGILILLSQQICKKDESIYRQFLYERCPQIKGGVGLPVLPPA
jgi:hypothetical protein